MILDTTGTPVAYLVAADDVMELVGDRFGLDTAYFYSINQVRRNGTELFVGDTLNLSAFTITSVGDQNGIVYDNDPPSPIPQQR